MEPEDPPILMKLKYLRSVMLQYRQEGTKDLFVQIRDILRDLTNKDSSNFEVPESLNYTDPYCVEAYVHHAQERQAKANELLEIKQTNFKRVVGLYEKGLKGPNVPPPQKPPADSLPLQKQPSGP